MDWGKVIYVFFSLMSLTSIAGFLYEHSATALFVAASLNLVSTFLKIGVRIFSQPNFWPPLWLQICTLFPHLSI